MDKSNLPDVLVVPYIGTWIETAKLAELPDNAAVVPYIGTWIETLTYKRQNPGFGRTLYRYVD